LGQTHGYEVDTAANGQEALDRLEQTGGRYDVALIDDLLVPAPGQEPEPMAVALIKEIKSRYPTVEIIIFTGWGMESGLEALRAGAYRYLAKPPKLEELGMLIQMAAEHGRLKGIAQEKQILERLMQTSPTLLSGRSLPDVLNTILHGVQAIGFDRVGLYLLSDDRQMMIGQAEVAINPAFVGHERPVASDDHMQILLSDARPHVFERENNQPLPFEQELGREGVDQWACVPLILHGDVIGKLTMDNKFSQRPILEAELGPVALFAAQAAAAIEQTQLNKAIAQERDHSKWLASQLLALHKITKEIQSELDLPRLLNLISRLAAELLEADAGGILLLDDEKKHLTFKGSYSLGQEIVEGTRDLIGGSLAGRVAETGEPIIANDIPNEPRFYNPAADGEGLLAVISTPLWIGGEVIGTLDVHSKTERFAFDEDDLQILSLMATQAASAIQNAKLFRQTHQRALTLEALYETSLEITRYHHIPELVNSILNRAVELLQAKGGGVYLLDESGERVKLAALADLPEHSVGMIVEAGDGVIGQVIKTRAPLAVSDYRNWPQRLRQYDAYDFTAVAGVPIIWQENIWGVIAIHDDVERRNFDQQELNLLAHLGNLAAVALENAELATKDADKLRRLEQLAQANSKIMGNLADMSLDERLNLIAKHASEILEAEACSILLVKRLGFLSFEASYGYKEENLMKGREFVICSGPQTGLTGHIAYEGKVFNRYGDGLLSHFAIKGKEQPQIASEKCYSLLVMPLKKRVGSEEELIGLLRLDNKQDHTGQAGSMIGFTQEDEWIVQLFADAAVVAIEAAELVAELNEQKNHWARLFASSPNGIIALNDQGDITGFSDQAQKILKYSPEEVLGQPVDFLYADQQEPRRIGGLLHAAKDSKLANYETVVRSKDGERIPIRMAATWLYDAQGDQIGSVGYFEDLRIIKETERRLDLLLKASNTVAQAENLNHGLQRLAEMMVTFLDISFCRSFLLDENQHCLIAKAVYPAPAPTHQLDWDPIPETVITIAEWPEIAEVLTQGRSNVLRIDDPQHQAFLVARSRRLGLKNDIQSLLLIPLKARDKVVGLLGLAELRPWEQAPFSKQKQELALAIANQTGLLIDRIYLYEITDRHRQLLEALDEASRNIRAETETFKLLQEVVRLAADLVDCTAGGLYINHPQLGELVLDVTYELPITLIGSRLSHAEGLIGLVAQTGQCQLIHNYFDWPGRENIFEVYHFKTMVGIPFKQVGEVEAVLFVADSTGSGRFGKADLDILERFAAQASIALQTSRLMSREQRIFGQLAILHKISDYIQTARDLEKILHVVLTGITAGYGLGFNRAALFLLDEQQAGLIGRMGIGHLDEIKARADWEREPKHRVDDFGSYLDLLEQDLLAPTPVGEQIRGLRLPVQETEADVFSRVITREEYCILATQEELDKLSDDFVEAFEPALPLVVVPLIARDQVIGLLIADNKFTRSPITSEDIETLLTYANTAAVAIDNIQLFHETEEARERLHSFYQASNTLVSSRDPEQVLHDIVEQACAATHAYGASLVLIDRIGQVRHLVSASVNRTFDTNLMVRSDGLSMRIMRTGQTEIIEDTGNERDRVNPSAFARGIGAAVGLPVSLEDKRIGVMWLDYGRPRRFSVDEIDSMRLYVNQAAIAYDSARRIRELEYMHQAARALASIAEPPAVLREIAQNACEVLQADSASVSSYDATEGKFTLKGSVATGIKHGVWQQFCQEGSWYTQADARVIKQGWFGVEDVGDEQEYKFLEEQMRPFYRQIEAGSFQGIVLTVGEDKLGVLYVNYNRPRSFSEEERRTAKTFANHAALALKRSQLLDEVNQALDQVRKAQDAARVVAEVTVLENLRSTLDSIVKGTRDILDCDVVTLWPYDPDRKDFDFPPAMAGVKYEEVILSWRRVRDDAVVRNILPLDDLHVAEDRMADLLLRGDFAEREGLVSSVGIPLIARGQKVGGMIVSYKNRHHFTNDELNHISLFAHQAAVAIRNAQLYDQSEKDRRRLEAVARIGQEVAESLEITRLLRTVCRRLERNLAEKQVIASIRLYDNTKNILTFDPDWHESFHQRIDVEAQKGRTTQQLTEGICGWVATHKESKNIRNVNEFANYLPLISDTQSELCVPICHGEEHQLVGVLDLQSPISSAFSEGDQKFLQTLADQLAVAIHKAQLYERVQRRVGVRQALYEASKVISMGIPLKRQKLLDRILEQAVERIKPAKGEKATFGVIQLYNEAADELRLESVYPTETLHVWKEKLGETRLLDRCTGRIGIQGRTVLERCLQRVDDVLSDPDYVAVRETTRSELDVPLLEGDKVLGVLGLESNQAAAFDEENEQTLLSFAELAVIAIQNARLYDEVRQRADQFQTLYQANLNLTAELSVEAVLQEVVHYARLLTGAQYGALGVLDIDNKINPFITSGMDPEEIVRIGPPPEGQGVLGLLLREPKPIRVPDISKHPEFTGFPPRHPKMTSFLGVPVISRGTFIGSLYMANKAGPPEFSQEDQNVLELLAAQAAIAIENARLFEQTQRRARLLDAAAEVARGATSILDEDQLLNQVVQLIVECFDFCYHAGVFLLDDDGKHAILQAASSEGGRQMLARKHSLEVGLEGIVGFVTQHGRPRLVSDVEQDPYHYPNPELADTRAEMAFPLIVHDRVIGALDVQSTQVVNLRAEDVATLQTMADQLANAIHNAYLYRQVTERLDEANALLQAAVSLTGASELEAVLTLIMTAGMKLINTQECSILFWDAQLEKFTQALRIEVGGKLRWYSTQARAQGGRARRIIDEQKPIAISDARQDPKFNPAFIDKGYRATLGVPLLSHGEPIGVLYVRDNMPHEFSDRQIALLEGLAGQAAVAIDRAGQYEELKHTKGLVGARTAVAWMGMVSATWRHAIEGHAITIEEEIEHLQADLPQACHDLIDKRIDKIQRLTRLILEKPITPPLSEEEGVESVAVNELLRERLRQLWENEPHKSVQRRLHLKLSDAATVRASPDWLRRMFDVLVDNAVEAMADTREPKLVVSTRQAGEQVEIAFADTGPGIPDDFLPGLFHKKIEKPQGAKGLGMGLLMAQTIAQTYGGDIRVESTNSTGTTMVVSLPIEANM
jgi:PAS domain S-box-containing protein